MSTELYHRTIKFDDGDEYKRALMEKVWSVTPWMIDCYTGEVGGERESLIRSWCYENIGPQAFPIHKKDGQWQFGSAVIHGWTWIGFATKEQMELFQSEFPLEDERC